MRICLVNVLAPPAGGSRGERTLHLSTELTRRGHQVTVIGAELPKGFPMRDGALDAELHRSGAAIVRLDPGRVPALRFPVLAPRRKARPLRVLAEAVWPDFWASFALASIRWIGEHRNAFDVVLTSGQPWSDHLAGYECARSFGLPWVADYGDPWGLMLTPSGWTRSIDYRVERRLLRFASSVVVTTEATRRVFLRHFDRPEESVVVIPAGVRWRGLGPPSGSEPMTLMHAGTVYGVRTSAIPLAEAVGSFRERSGQLVRLLWFGELWRPEDAASIHRVADEWRDRVSSSDVARAEGRAHIIVVLGNRGGVQVPGKIWRALGTGRLLLVIQADGQDALRDLPELAGRAVFTVNDANAIDRALGECAERLRKWDWGGARRPPDLPGWDARAEALEGCLVRALESPAPRRRGSLSAATWIRLMSFSGLRLGSVLRRYWLNRSR